MKTLAIIGTVIGLVIEYTAFFNDDRETMKIGAAIGGTCLTLLTITFILHF